MKVLAAVVAATVFVTATAVWADDIIIESRPEGQNYDKYKETEGKWLDSNSPALTAKSGAPGLTPQGKCGSRKYVVGAGGGDSKTVVAAARFSPRLSKPGHYYVYVTFPKAGNATPVTYVIKHAKGQETKSLAQDGWGGVGNPNASTWISLGDYDFAAGDDQYVEMQITGEAGPPDPRTPGQAFTDGVRFSSAPVSDAKEIASGSAATPRSGEATPASVPGASSSSTPVPPQSAANAQLTWLEDIRTAQDVAGKSGKKIFLFFYSPESERSNNYDKKVFNNAAVKQVLSDRFVLVRVNIDENRTLANNLQVFRAGTINLYDDRGNGITQFTETLDADELASKLKGM